MMRKVILTTLVLALMATSAMGYGYRYNTVFSTSESPFDYNNNWAPYSYPNNKNKKSQNNQQLPFQHFQPASPPFLLGTAKTSQRSL